MAIPSSTATARRMLLAKSSVEATLASLLGYQGLQQRPASKAQIELRVAAGWVELRFPVEAPVYHFHNLAVWLADTPDAEQKPSDVIVLSEGEGDWAYWLVPGPESDRLTGATALGRPFQVDVPIGRTVDNVKDRRAPMATGLMYLTRAVPPGLQHALSGAPVATYSLPLDAEATPWAILPTGGGSALGWLKGLFGGS